MKSFNDAEIQHWKTNGYIVKPGFFDQSVTKDLIHWTTELQNLRETANQWMMYYEAPLDNASRRQLCRIENFLQYQPGFQSLLTGGAVLSAISDLIGEPAVLFKEKVNFKLSGANGFEPHQDAPAFTSFGQTYHVTMMVAVDPATRKNGCLEVVPAMNHLGILPSTESLVLSDEFCTALNWVAIEMEPGDVIFFDSYVPHRSGPNLTLSSRRALYVTYNPTSQGSFRDQYYARKREIFPPDIERVPGKIYGNSGVFNVGNPIKRAVSND